MVWQAGPVRRALGAGLAAGVFFAAFVLIESASWVAAAAVVVVLTPLYGIRTARRLGRAWPGARELAPDDRAAVVRATRRGEPVGDPRLAPAVLGYAEGLRRVCAQDRLHRWVVVAICVLSAALAVSDTLTGSAGETTASWILFALCLLDLTWYPRRRALLMERAARAETAARATRRPGPPDGPEAGDGPDGPRADDRSDGPQTGDGPDGPGAGDGPDGPRTGDRPDGPRTCHPPDGPDVRRPDGPQVARPDGPQVARPDGPQVRRPDGPGRT